MRFLAADRPDVRVIGYDYLGGGREKPARLRDRLEAGGYVVTDVGRPFAQEIERQFPADRLIRWDGPWSIYRLRRPGETAPTAVIARGSR